MSKSQGRSPAAIGNSRVIPAKAGIQWLCDVIPANAGIQWLCDVIPAKAGIQWLDEVNNDTGFPLARERPHV